ANSAQTVGDQGMYGAYLLDRLIKTLHAKEYSLNLAPELMPLPDLQALSDGRFDGLVWLNIVPHGPLLEAFYASPVPVVAIGGIYGEMPDRGALFLIEEETSYRTILDHLAGLGHRRILYSDRPVDRYDALGEARAEGLTVMAKSYGIEVIVRAAKDANEAFEVWKELSSRPTAIVAYSDHRGAMLMQAARENGVRVPEDLSILTFDGSPLSLWGWPGLTTIRPPVDQLADLAIEHLIQQMERLPIEPVLQRYPATLYEAGSTGPASA
ncbi:LacI family transcriptional regulator, partial [bacterium]